MRNAWTFLKWLLYAAMTQNERLAYEYGKTRGIHCSRVGHGFNSTYLTLHPGVKPYRMYLTRKEFFAQYA